MLSKIATLTTIAAGMFAAGLILIGGGDPEMGPSPVESSEPDSPRSWQRSGSRLRDAAAVVRQRSSVQDAEARVEPLRLCVERGFDNLLGATAFASIEAGELGSRTTIDPATNRSAIEALRFGRAAAAITTRRPTEREARDGLSDFVVGHWVAAVVVHPANPLRSLTASQSRQLLSGQIRNWSELGGRPQPVRLVLPPGGQMAALITRAMLPGDKLGSGDKERDPTARLREVASDPTAVTVVALPQAERERAAILAIDMTLPSQQAVRSGQYPHALPLYLICGPNPEPRMQQLADGLRQDALARFAPAQITPATLSLAAPPH